MIADPEEVCGDRPRRDQPLHIAVDCFQKLGRGPEDDLFYSPEGKGSGTWALHTERAVASSGRLTRICEPNWGKMAAGRAGLVRVLSELDPSDVAERVLAAINDDELYVFTHPNMRAAVEKRFAAILTAMDRVKARKR